MKYIPMPYSAPMIVAKLAGRKTQTRRVVAPQPPEAFSAGPVLYPSIGWRWIDREYRHWPGPSKTKAINGILSPRGDVGDRQYWQEAFDFSITNFPMIRYKADGVIEPLKFSQRDEEIFARWKWPKDGEWRGMPAMFMLRSMSRGMDEVTDLRVERVQEISEVDAEAEGVALVETIRGLRSYAASYRAAYASLWNQINVSRGHSWESNPWVWAYTTKEIK